MPSSPANRPGSKALDLTSDSEEFILPKSPPILPSPERKEIARPSPQSGNQAEPAAKGHGFEKRPFSENRSESINFDCNVPFTWFRAAESGNALAMASLGDAYCWGGYITCGIPRDPEKGVELLVRSSQQGHPLGTYLLSRAQRILAGYRQHPEVADQTEFRSAHAGFLNNDRANFPVWQIAEAIALREGRITQVDIDRQFKLIEACVESDYTDAWSLYGSCLLGGEGVTSNPSEGVEWFRRAAEKQNGTAMNMLGYCYRNGLGVTADAAAAVTWYHMAARNGQDDALNSLGYLTMRGIGCRRSAGGAFQFYRKAAELRHPLGCYNVGIAYEIGQGIRRDRNQAAYWYRRAVELGHVKAAQALQRIGAQK